MLVREILSREEAAYMFNISESEFEMWLSPYAGYSPIPQMPHIAGRPKKFPAELLREWRLKYFMKGGDGQYMPQKRFIPPPPPPPEPSQPVHYYDDPEPDDPGPSPPAPKPKFYANGNRIVTRRPKLKATTKMIEHEPPYGTPG